MNYRAAAGLIPLCMIMSVSALFAQSPGSEWLLIDDFARSQSAVGTEWEGFTDRVMGGRSEMSVTVVPDGDDRVLRMRGRVSLENNGGFIQVRVPLADRGAFDAREYEGVAVELRVRNAGSYYVHMRTAQNLAPWTYFAQQIPSTLAADSRDDGRQDDDQHNDGRLIVQLPFEGFESELMFGSPRPNLRRVRSLALVAASDNFEADIELSRIWLYR